MSTSHDLKNIGLKATLPRLKILNLFENSDVRHLTAEDVYKMLLGEGMEIGLDPEADRRRFHVTEKGRVLVVPEMLEKLQ